MFYAFFIYCSYMMRSVLFALFKNLITFFTYSELYLLT